MEWITFFFFFANNINNNKQAVETVSFVVILYFNL